MTSLIKGIVLLTILLATISAEAEQKCRDKELETACKTAIEAADELIRQKQAKEIYLESLTQMQLYQIENQAKMLVDAINPPWYRDFRVTLLIGVIAGGLSYEAIRNR